MPVTERLYYFDSHLIDFEARVVDVTERVSGWTAIVLDRTAFYPTGGGQPSDTGTLDGSRVVECIDDGDNIFHVVQGSAPRRDAVVRGRIDWSRRLDHIQQHTGQHILSQALIALFKAPTRSFRVMEAVCEIDVDLHNPSTERIERAVELANNVIWEDRAITTFSVPSDQIAELHLRKEPTREGELRVIDIEGFDQTPCGGTHAVRTGEVGMIAVRSWSHAKGLTRIEFVAGMRALADYRKANKSAREMAARFSTGRDDAPQVAAHMVEENKELHRRIRLLEEEAAGFEAERLLARARNGVVAQVFDNRDVESLKKLAHALISAPGTVALLASRDKDTARLVFARSADASGDMNVLMLEACAMLDGRGGGKPEMAQGGGKRVEQLEETLRLMEKKLTV